MLWACIILKSGSDWFDQAYKINLTKGTSFSKVLRAVDFYDF